MNNGYIGTYEPTYKLLHNKKEEYLCCNLACISSR